MNKCFSEPRDSSHRREGKDCLAESPTFRPQRRLKIKGGMKAPHLTLVPCQAKSIGHLHCVWQNWVSVPDPRRREERGKGGRQQGGLLLLLACCPPLERESDRNASP